MELVEQMPKVETAEFDPIGLFFLLVAVVPVVHWLWKFFSKSVDIEEWASSRGLGFVEYDREFGRELSRLLSLPGQDHVARDVIAVPAPYGSCLYGWIRWIERNEGSRRDDAPEDVAVKHIIDSLTAYDEKLFAPARTLIDVGTGAGLPGIPLAVYAPKIEVTLMDALGKRVKFLTEAAAAMELRNVRCIHARAEEAARRPEHRARYDIAVSRAVARLPVLLEYTLPFVRTGGTLLALKGRAYAAEQAEGKRAAEILGGGAISARPVRLPGLDDVRAILAVTKERPTPKGYPRRAGLPERAPLK